MSEPKKAVIAEIKETEKFYNVITHEGISIGIGKDKNPVLAKQLASAKAGDEIIYTPWEKDGKHYGFDPKAGGTKAGGKTFTPKDKSFDAAIAAAQAAATAISLKKESSTADFDIYFEHIHKAIMNKVTK